MYRSGGWIQNIAGLFSYTLILEYFCFPSHAMHNWFSPVLKSNLVSGMLKDQFLCKTKLTKDSFTFPRFHMYILPHWSLQTICAKPPHKRHSCSAFFAFNLFLKSIKPNLGSNPKSEYHPPSSLQSKKYTEHQGSVSQKGHYLIFNL